jgi:hypothetical protein
MCTNADRLQHYKRLQRTPNEVDCIHKQMLTEHTLFIIYLYVYSFRTNVVVVCYRVYYYICSPLPCIIIFFFYIYSVCAVIIDHFSMFASLACTSYSNDDLFLSDINHVHYYYTLYKNNQTYHD